MFIAVGDKVFDIVNGLIATTDLNFVYNYEKKIGDSGYPYATITPTSTVEKIYSSNANMIDIPFVIAVYVRSESIAVAEVTIRTIVDAILTGLRGDEYLTGSVNKAQFDIERAYSDDEQPTRVALIKATYTTLLC